MLHAHPPAAAAAAADPARHDGSGEAVCRLHAERRAFGCEGSSRGGSATSGSPIGCPGRTTERVGGLRYETVALSKGLGWTPVEVFGTVPVEADGSAHFQVPADTAVYFQLLDEN